MKDRNLSIDIMRVIGVLLIILAHVFPPDFLFQIRTFDVPMMVFISGACYSMTKKKNISIVSYVYSRVKRMVFPVWIFLIFFFSFLYIFRPHGFEDILKVKVVISSFLLNGFGYFWVIRVFLIIAIISPVLVYLVENKSDAFVISLIILLLLFGVVLDNIKSYFKLPLLISLINQCIIPAISYGAAFIFGYKWIDKNTKERLVYFLTFVAVFAFCLLSYYIKDGVLYWPQDFKNPATMLYILYSLSVTPVVYYMVRSLSKTNDDSKLHNIILFYSSNTIWIYLWHIPLVEYFKNVNPDVHYLVKYGVVVFISAIITYIQISIVKLAMLVNPNRYKYLKVLMG